MEQVSDTGLLAQILGSIALHYGPPPLRMLLTVSYEECLKSLRTQERYHFVSHTVTATILDIGGNLESKTDKDLSFRILSSSSKLKPPETNVVSFTMGVEQGARGT